MASRTFVELVDDLDGGDADETVSFGLDGRQYEIDLSAGNAKKLRELLAEFEGVARRVSTRNGSRSRSQGPRQGDTDTDAAAIREWAVANGVEVNTRGRIPAHVREAYEAR